MESTGSSLKVRQKEKLPRKMSDSGGNPHLEGIISDFEGSYHLLFLSPMIFILADHDKQQRLTAVCNIKKVTNSCLYAIIVKPIIVSACLMAACVSVCP